MYASSGTGTVSLTTYSNNSTYNDECNIAKIGYMSETATLEGQQTGSWCWAAASRMFAKQHANFNSNITQLDAVRAVATVMDDGHLTDTQLESYGGDIGMGLMAINYYLGVTPLTSSSVATTYGGQAFTESQILSRLEQGQPIYVIRGVNYIDSFGESRFSGHAMIVYGYVSIDGDNIYLIRDPLPEDYGSSYFMSFEKMCNGNNALAWESPDDCFWNGSIVLS